MQWHGELQFPMPLHSSIQQHLLLTSITLDAMQATVLTPLDLKSAIVREPLVVSPDMPIMEAIAYMSGVRSLCATTQTLDTQFSDFHLEARSSCVLAVEGGQVVGILTERDVVRLSAEQKPLAQLVVRQVMAHPVVTLQESALADLFQAIHLIQQHHIRHLPLVNGQGYPIGLLTHESLRYISRPIDLLRLRQVSEVMMPDVIWATSDSSMLAIAQLMAKHRVSSVVIVEEKGGKAEGRGQRAEGRGQRAEGRGQRAEGERIEGDGQGVVPGDPSGVLRIPVGMVTERDLVQFQALGLGLEQCTAGAVMSAPIFAVTAEDSLWAVHQLMEQRFIRRVVVTGGQGQIQGIVTQTSLLQALNPLELYRLAELLEEKVVRLEAEKVALLESRTTELERQVAERTAALEAKAKQDRLIAMITTQIRLSLNLQDILDTVVQEVRSLLECDRVAIYQFRTGAGGTIVAEARTHEGQRLFPEPLPGWDCSESTCEGTIRMPITVRQQLWGLLTINALSPDQVWSPNHIELVRQLTIQLAIAIQQSTTYHKVKTELEERKRAEALLRDSERRYATLAAIAPVGIFRTDAAGNCLYVNERWCTFTGLRGEEALGMGWMQVLHPDDRERVMQEWESCLCNHHIFQLEYRFQLPDGTVTWVYGQVAAERDEADQVIGYVGTVTDISDRKRSEEALRKSEAHQRALISAIPDLIARVNREGTYLEFVANPNFSVVGNLPQIIGTHVSETLPAAMAQKRLDCVEQALQTNTIQVYEQDLSIDGKTQIEEVRVVPYGEDEALLLVRDVSDRKQAEAERLQAEQVRKELSLLEGILEIILAGYWDWDIPHNQEYLSPGFKRMFGYADHELPNTPESWQAIIFPEDAARLFANFEQHVQSRGAVPFQNEVRYHHKDGSTVWVICSGQVIEWDGEGNPLRMIGCHIDISDRKRTEDALKRQLAAVEAAIDGIAILQGSTYLYLNQAHVKLFGYDHPEELLGHSWQLLYSPEELARFEREVFPVLGRDRSWQGEATATRKDGSTFAEGLSLTLTEEGLLICVCRDISEQQAALWERQKAEEELQRTNEELARATRLKDEFLANMSHELRTPLNAILGMTEGLREQVFGTINPQQIKALQTIERSGCHLLELINDILDVAKIESGQIDLDLKPTPLMPLCQSSLSFIKQQALKKRIQVEMKVPLDLPDVQVDERRIRQVLINLLNNAVKFTPEKGRITLEVSRLAEAESQTESSALLRISVIDTGIGIAPEHISKLFQPFIQIDSALNRKYQGTGLGLALVKRIVELHGGRVGLTSQEGSGSCFTIDLPYLKSPLSTVEAEEPGAFEIPPLAPLPHGSPLILIAEDNDANIITMSSYLSAKDYRLIVARNGQEAIALAQSEQPDIILMDIQMPGMDGLEAMKIIRQNPALTTMPIIALTALAMPGDREKCLEAGASDYLSKPVQLKQLALIIQQLLT